MEEERHTKMKAVFLFEDNIFTASQNTTSIDMTHAGSGNVAESLVYLITIGAAAVAGTGGSTIEVIVQESDNDSVWTSVPEELVLGGVTLATSAGFGVIIPLAAQNTLRRLGTLSKKRYQRLRLFEDGSITAGQVTVQAILQDMRQQAQPDQNS